MVAIDNTTLVLLFHPGAKPPNDPKTGRPLVKARERIEQLITDLDARICGQTGLELCSK